MGFRLAYPFRRIIAIRQGYTLTAERIGEPPAYFDGYNGSPPFVFGSISPATFRDVGIRAFASPSTTNGSSSFDTTFGLYDLVSAGFFESITVNGVTLLAASASFVQAAGSSFWTWSGPPILSGPGTYPMQIKGPTP